MLQQINNISHILSSRTNTSFRFIPVHALLNALTLLTSMEPRHSMSDVIKNPQSQLLDRKKRIWAIVGASSGNLVEWFDFYVYSFFSLYFAHIFFPQGDTTTQLLQTAGVFAAGFLMRPIGGWLFGYIGDRHGRKKSMLISVCMMCFGSLVIACLPGYNSIGIAAPALLLLARMFQGLSVGGEYGTSATYMSEVALEGRKGFYASFQYVTLIGGQLAAVLTVVVLQFILTDQELRTWGWRIPFFLGAALAVVALWLRRSLDETSDKQSREHRDAGSVIGLLRNHTKPFLMVLGFTAGGSLSFYTFTTYMQKYLVNTSGMDAKTASALMTGVLFVYMLLQPVIGGLSDKIGRRTSMMIFGAGAAICTVPILTLLQNVQSPGMAFVLIMLALLITSFYTSISGILKAEMFPPQVRALGVGLSYAVANAIFGGSAEYVALLMKHKGMETTFFWYVSAMGALAFLVSLLLHRHGKGIKL
ncbi:alpha-ketoglutarate transporter [Pantoea ananatis 15320]|nr:alpha-ketoglutarate transporter [Pantoea ananatis 15320]